MQNVAPGDLSHFLRVIALLVLEVNEKQTFKDLNINSGMQVPLNHIVMNQSMLVSQPSFLNKVILISTNMIHVLSRLLSCQNDDALLETIETLRGSETLYNSGIQLDQINKLFQDYDQIQLQQMCESKIAKKFIIENCLKNSSLMELLFILQNLLIGRKKLTIQSALDSLDFVEKILTPLFDIFFHDEFDIESIESEQDEDSKDIGFTARIQLLRLIVNYTDRDGDNLLLKSRFITPVEHSLLKNIEIPLILHTHHIQKGKGNQPIDAAKKYTQLIQQYSTGLPVLTESEINQTLTSQALGQAFGELVFPSSYHNRATVIPYHKNRLECIQEKGLMHRIIDCMQRIGNNCQLRFWLGNSVEVFLRGSHWYLQLFVWSSGLPYLLMKQFVMNSLFKVNNIQITLDILSELVKFNLLNTMYLNILLIEKGWMKSIEEKMFKNIIDSNVLLRNFYLTYQACELTKITQPRSIFTASQDKNNLLFQLLCEKNAFFTLTNLIKNVNEDNIGLENISCVPSALVYLIFAGVKGTLEQTIVELIRFFNNTDILQKFTRVLNIWTYHLQLKPREIYSLQFASKIPMSYFQQIIRVFHEKFGNTTALQYQEQIKP